MDARRAWEARYAREPRPWRGGPDAALDPWLARLPPGPCLDLGAGGGRTHAALAARGAVAVDWVRAAVADAPRAVVADLAALPVRAGAFRAAVAVHAFGALEAARLPRAAAEAARALAPGGRLLVVEFGPGDLRAASGEPAPGGGRLRGGILTRYVGAEEVAAWFPALRPLARGTLARATRYGERERTAVLFEKP